MSQQSTNEFSLDIVRKQLAPTGLLRAGINMSNFLLVNSELAGEPDGVSPDMAKAIAKILGVETQLLAYEGPGLIADAAVQHEWDIANIAAELERAKTISFSPAYCEIQATYLLPEGSSFNTIEDVDASGVRIAVKNRTAYDLWLTDNLKHATLVRVPSMDDSFNEFKNNTLDALAGLRPRLSEDQKSLPGSTLMKESFTAVQQSIGCLPGNAEANAFLAAFVRESIESGLVASLIDKHGVKGKLSVAQAVSV